MLADGSYDVVVVDAHATDGGLKVDLTILGGEHKGDVLSLNGPASTGRDPLDLLGVPGTLVVTDGQPSLRLEG